MFSNNFSETCAAMSLQIVKRNENSNLFEFCADDLKKILLEKNVKDREVVVISIAGAFRKGKSFLLNFFIRYLRKTVTNCKMVDFDPLMIILPF